MRDTTASVIDPDVRDRYFSLPADDFVSAVRISCKLSLFLFLTMPVSRAQETKTDALEQIVVTATRIESALRDVARSISVVHKDRIQNATQQLGLDEVLNGIPGLYMQNRYNFAQDLRVAIRGFGLRSSFGIRGIKIFVDDIPETLPDGQAQVDSIRKRFRMARRRSIASISVRPNGSRFCAGRHHRSMAMPRVGLFR